MSTFSESVDSYVKESKKIIGDIPVEHIQNNVDEYLNMTEEELDKLNKEACVYGQYLITQYAISLSRKLNTLKGKLSVNKRTFDRYLSKYVCDENKYFNYDTLRAKACASDSDLRCMDNEICKIESLIQEYDGIVVKLEKMSQIFRDLSFCRSN